MILGKAAGRLPRRRHRSDCLATRRVSRSLDAGVQAEQIYDSETGLRPFARPDRTLILSVGVFQPTTLAPCAMAGVAFAVTTIRALSSRRKTVRVAPIPVRSDGNRAILKSRSLPVWDVRKSCAGGILRLLGNMRLLRARFNLHAHTHHDISDGAHLNRRRFRHGAYDSLLRQSACLRQPTVIARMVQNGSTSHKSRRGSPHNIMRHGRRFDVRSHQHAG